MAIFPASYDNVASLTLADTSVLTAWTGVPTTNPSAGTGFNPTGGTPGTFVTLAALRTAIFSGGEITGNLTVDGTLTVTGLGTFSSGVAVTGGITMTTGALTVVNPATGIALRIVAGTDGTYGTNETLRWFRPDGTTLRGYLGFNATNNQTFTIGTAETGGVMVLASDNNVPALTISAAQLVTLAAGLVVTSTTTHNAAVTVSAGKLTTAASVTGTAGLSLPSGTAPTSPADGDMWYDGTNVKFRVGGSTKTFTLT